MHEKISAIYAAFVADIMAVLDGDTSGMENRDLDTVALLVGYLLICIIGPCPFEAQMQGGLVEPMKDLRLNLCLKRAAIGDATRAIRRLLGRQIRSRADLPL